MKPLSYGAYLRLPQLLSLQEPAVRPPHLDEVQFIIVHQAFELWFKLVLHGMDDLFAALEAGRLREAARLLGRIAQIERLWLQQIHILETMGPADFLRFRAALAPASGLQSSQFREIEFASGLKEPRYLALFEGDAEATRRLEARLAAPSLWDAFLGGLARAGLDVGKGRTGSLKALYTDPALEELRALAEAMIEHDECLSLWRAHHIHMVGRMIGSKPGTGHALVKDTLKAGEAMGSQGVGYLGTTLERKCFPELWEVRTLLEASPA